MNGKVMCLRHRIVIYSIIFCCAIIGTGFTSGMGITNEFVDSSVQDITLQDDAFHGRRYLPFIEWWYFDAKFENGYTIAFSVQVIDLIVKRMVSTRLSIFNQGTVVLKSYEKYPLKEFFASPDIPFITIAGKQLMSGMYDASRDCFVYNLTIEVPEGSLSLEFIGCTKGWKLQHQTRDWWGVILPCANVTGTITLDSMKIHVTGIGYHDHNWHVSPRIVSKFGWIWGTCHSENYTITWAEVYSTRLTSHPILVINEKDGGYLDIPPDAIWFSTKKTKIDHLKFIPWLLNIETTSEKVLLIINMEVTSMDHTKFLGFIDYWRYHMTYTGTIITDCHMETVEGTSIMECLRF